MPARSRHCNSERICRLRHWERSWEGAEGRWTGARRTAWLTITVWPASDGDGDLSIRDVWSGLFAMHNIDSHFYSDDESSSLVWEELFYCLDFVLYFVVRFFFPGQGLGRRNAHTFHSVLWNSCDHGLLWMCTAAPVVEDRSLLFPTIVGGLCHTGWQLHNNTLYGKTAGIYAGCFRVSICILLLRMIE